MGFTKFIRGSARHGGVRHGSAGQGKARQGIHFGAGLSKAELGNARHRTAIQGMGFISALQGEPRQPWAWPGKARHGMGFTKFIALLG
jgi:hypothetical protein